MSSKKISITQAFENLHSLASAQYRQGVALLSSHTILFLGQEIQYKTVSFEAKQSLESDGSFDHAVKETLGVVMDHMRRYCNKEGQKLDTSQVSQGAGSIMGLVSNAAKGVDQIQDRIGSLQNYSLRTNKEYHQLTDFYKKRFGRRKVSPEEYIEINDRILDASYADSQELATGIYHEIEQALNHIDYLQDDRLYEFYYLVHQDGGYWLKAPVIRQMQVYCDFLDLEEAREKGEQEINFHVFQDKSVQVLCANIYKSSYYLIDNFIKSYVPSKDHEVKDHVAKACYALALAAASANLLRHRSKKICSDYFRDFIYFIRAALAHEHYHKVTGSEKIAKSWHATRELLDLWSKLLVQGDAYWYELAEPLDLILRAERGIVRDRWGSSQLVKDYQILSTVFSQDGYGAIRRSLSSIRSGWRKFGFDPHYLGYNNYELFKLRISEREVSMVHLPSIVRQDQIQRACVNEEFIQALKADSEKKYLLINLQDRSHWKEHARTIALENLNKDPQLRQCVDVITLDHTSSFYRQEGEYAQMNQAQAWLEVFIEQILGEGSGYYFPKKLFTLLENDIEDIFQAIWLVFFERKNILTRAERLQFIDLAHCFLSLYLIGKTRCNAVSFITKDGLEQSLSNSALVYLILRSAAGPLESHDLDFVDTLLNAPSLLQRERMIDLEWVQRLSLALNVMDENLCRLGRDVFHRSLDHFARKLGWKGFDVELIIDRSLLV